MRMHASFCLSAPIPPSLLSVRSFSRLPFSPLHSPSLFSRIVKLALSRGRPASDGIYRQPPPCSLCNFANQLGQSANGRGTDGWMDADDGDSLTGSPCLSRPVSPLSKAPSSSAREGEKNVSQADKRTNDVLRSDDARSGGGLN